MSHNHCQCEACAAESQEWGETYDKMKRDLAAARESVRVIDDAWQKCQVERNAAREECERLRDDADAEMLRVKACEHIAEDAEGWERLVDLCPSTAAVAIVRRERDALRVEVAALKKSRDLSEVHVIDELHAEVERLTRSIGANNGWDIVLEARELRARVTELERLIEAARPMAHKKAQYEDRRRLEIAFEEYDAARAAAKDRPGLQEWHGENERHGPPHRGKR